MTETGGPRSRRDMEETSGRRRSETAREMQKPYEISLRKIVITSPPYAA